MPCVNGDTGRDCINHHWLAALGGGKGEDAGWRADCPACGAGRALSLTLSHGRVIWHHFCSCAETAVGQQIIAKVACYTGRKRRVPAIDRDELIGLTLDLAADKTLGTAARHLALLRFAGMSTPDAAAALKLPPRTRRDAVNQLAARHQATPKSVRKRRPG